MKLFLPLQHKIKIIKIFLSANHLKFYDHADSNYPVRSSKGHYRPYDGLLGIRKKFILPSKYPVNPVKKVKFGTFVFYEMNADIKNWGGWYESFPFSSGYLNRIELRSVTLKDGFRPK